MRLRLLSALYRNLVSPGEVGKSIPSAFRMAFCTQGQDRRERKRELTAFTVERAVREYSFSLRDVRTSLFWPRGRENGALSRQESRKAVVPGHKECDFSPGPRNPGASSPDSPARTERAKRVHGIVRAVCGRLTAS